MTGAIATNPMGSVIYRALIRTYARSRRNGRTARLWKEAWDWACAHYQGPVRYRLHGHPVVINFGNIYPLILRDHSLFNSPLIELVYQAFRVKGRPITFIDVGAAAGDTVLLLHASCSGMIDTTCCYDGDAEFFAYLEQNLAGISGIRLRRVMLSAAGEELPELVRVHGGTASAQGEGRVTTTTLDRAIAEDGIAEVDVLKVDVDGYDGRILAGAVETLRTRRPAVVFEWYPPMCVRTATRHEEGFEVLSACGYSRFVFFNRYGQFSHFMGEYDVGAVAKLGEFCRTSQTEPEHHYDVVALPQDSAIPEVPLADMLYARRHKHG